MGIFWRMQATYRVAPRTLDRNPAQKTEILAFFRTLVHGRILTDYLKYEDEYVELFTRDQSRGFEVTRGPEAQGLRRIRGFGRG